MFGFGFKAGGSGDEDPDKENRTQSSPAGSPWTKKQKVTPDVDLASVRRKLPTSSISSVSPETSPSLAGDNPDNKHTNLVKSIR